MNAPPATSPDFNRIARPYRWLEYLVLGALLQQTRTHFLPDLKHSRQALLLGDGDGRFLVELLKTNPNLTADVVDLSAVMLRLLSSRARSLATPPVTNLGSSGLPTAPRLRTHHWNALNYVPDRPHDLIVTHFFLDCLTQAEVDRLTQELVPTLSAGALWVVSEFRIPPGILRIPAGLFVRVLYFAFRLFTGLRVNRLPDHNSSFVRAGLIRVSHQHRLFGLLTAELWQKHLP